MSFVQRLWRKAGASLPVTSIFPCGDRSNSPAPASTLPYSASPAPNCAGTSIPATSVKVAPADRWSSASGLGRAIGVSGERHPALVGVRHNQTPTRRVEQALHVLGPAERVGEHFFHR